MKVMACQEFAVLYTHQKTKKSKVWQDGVLKSTVGGNKATLFDDKGQILDSIFVKFQIKPGDDLESERYLITVEDENTSKTACNDQPKNSTIPTSTRNNLKPPVSSLRLPMGLKRKFSGFQGPRQVEKKITMEEALTVSSHKIPQSSFPSQFYDSSPLFSVPYKEREKSNLLPNINRDAVITNERDPCSPASMAFTSCVDYPKVPSRNHGTLNTDTEYRKTQSQMDNGMVNSDCHTSSDRTVSQNIRSKAQIIALLKLRTALLSKDQKESETPPSGTMTSFKNLPLKLGCQPEGMPLSELSGSTDTLFKQTVSPFLGSTSNSNEETSKSIQTLHSSDKPVQTKSRWDAYLPLCVAEEPPDSNDAGHKDENAGDLQPVKKDVKEDGNVNRNQSSEDHKEMPQLPASLENYISPIGESCAKIHSSVLADSGTNKEDDIEMSSSTSAPYSNCINKTEIFASHLSESGKCAMIDTSKGFCHQSQSEPYSMIHSEPVLDHSVNKNVGDLDKDFPEVNFNLVDTVDFSETEDGELEASSTLSQGSVCLEEKMEMQLETVVQKNCELEACEWKDNIPSTFSQDTSVNCNLGSQPVHFCDEVPENPNKIEENGATLQLLNESRHPESAVFENITATSINHTAVHSSLDCNSRDLLLDNNGHCTQTIQAGKQNLEPYVPSNSNTYIKNEEEVGGDNSQLCSTGICDNMNLASSLQSSTENNSCDGVPEYVSDCHNAALEKSYNLDFRPVDHLLKGETSSEESEISDNKLENTAVVLDSNCKSTDETDFICLKSSAVDSSNPPNLINSFSLLRSLTEHNTALESLQVIEESTDVLIQREKIMKKNVSNGESEGY